MKNLNPISGLRQITSGYIYLPRKMILELIRNKKIKPSELGYFIILLVSADWDTSIYRKGYIRHEFTRLSTIWNIPCSTLYDYSKTLRNKQLLDTGNDTLKITNFDCFTYKGAETLVKNKPTNEYLEQLLLKSISASEISEKVEAEVPLSFSVSSNSVSNVYPRKVIIKQEIRSKEEYQKIYETGDFRSLTTEDMRCINENVNEKIEIENEDMEQDIVKIYFDGNWNKYKSCLIP